MATTAVDLSEFNRFLADVGQWNDKMLDIIAEALVSAGVTIVREVKERTPVYTGILRASITEELIIGRNAMEEVIGTPLEYAPYVEEGTRPHFPPLAPLRLWALRKLGDESLAYPIALAISRRGTRAVRMFEQGLAAAMPRVDGFFAAAEAKIAAMMEKG